MWRHRCHAAVRHSQPPLPSLAGSAGGTQRRKESTRQDRTHCLRRRQGTARAAGEADPLRTPESRTGSDSHETDSSQTTMVFKNPQSKPCARQGESATGLPGSIGCGKRREFSQELRQESRVVFGLGRASPLLTSLHGLMGQAEHNPASGEARPDAREAVGCPRSTRRTGEPSTGGRRTRLDAACNGKLEPVMSHRSPQVNLLVRQ